MRLFKLGKNIIKALNAKLQKELGVIVYMNCAPGIKLQFHGPRE